MKQPLSIQGEIINIAIRKIKITFLNGIFSFFIILYKKITPMTPNNIKAFILVRYANPRLIPANSAPNFIKKLK